MSNYHNNPIRSLAKQTYWQTLYSRAKEIGSINLFDNSTEYSKLQILFLQWLEVYNSLYADLYLKEPYISEEIIEDEIRTDAYLLWKRKERDKEKRGEVPTLKKNIPLDGHQGIPTVNFE